MPEAAPVTSAVPLVEVVMSVLRFASRWLEPVDRTVTYALPRQSLLGETGIHRSVLRKGRAMDRLEAMSIVLAVAEAGSLSAAARRLNTPPATASRKITELEQHLRAKLFDRSSRKLTPTDSGLSYVVALKRILADLSEADRAATGEYTAPTGELIVTASVTLGRLYLIPILAEFLRAYPDIDIRLVLADRILSLPEDHVDVALRVGTLPTVLDEFQPPTRPVSFVYTAGRFMPIKLRAFLDFAAPRLKTRLA